MILGKQSVFNDLTDLKSDLEQKIEDSASSGGGGSGAAVENIIFGGVFDARPTGMYTMDFDIEGQVSYGGALFHIDNSWSGEGFSAGLNIGWDGEAAIQLVSMGDHSTFRLLTSKNTITDSNGFIKAA